MEGSLALCTASRFVRSFVVCLRARGLRHSHASSSLLSGVHRSHGVARSLAHSRSVLIVLMSDPVGHDSSVREVLAEVAEFSRQLVHHLLEDHRVDVLPWNCRERGQQLAIVTDFTQLSLQLHKILLHDGRGLVKPPGKARPNGLSNNSNVIHQTTYQKSRSRTPLKLQLRW